MIRRSALIASAAAVLVIAGCSGNDDDGNSGPTPTPTPTPTATATPTYSALPLATATTAAEFPSISASTSYSGDIAGAVALGTAATDAFSNRVRFALQGNASSTLTSEFVAVEATDEWRFTGADVLTAAAPAVTEIVLRKTPAPNPTATPTPIPAGKFGQLDVLNNIVTGQVTSDAALALTRSTYAGWWRGDSTTGQKRITYGVMGYPTVGSDVPTSTATVNYNVRVTGRSVISAAGGSTVAKLGGSATVSVNYATGLVNVSVVLTRDGAAYSSFTGTGAIAAGNAQFTGSFGAGNTFQGLLYGPQAAEIGITFAITDDGATPSRTVGVVIGKKS